MMTRELGEDALPHFGELWYESEHSHLTRLAYMNAATRLYEKCFCRQLGDWCRQHGVIYVGHIIEDMNAHTRLGCSAGHYFRALSGQDMSGIDIVLHQVLPGLGGYTHTCSGSGGAADPEFYHYVLAKLGASAAHLLPHMNGRAMCEVFGAYGWGEDATCFKWLIDFLLVRGINHFVPHAFSPSFPNDDCPPHFGAEGHDPQLDGFSAVMRYTNKAAHLLSGGVHTATAAILYHAEGEWMNARDGYMLTQKPAKSLYDRQIDFDIVTADMLYDDAVVNGRLTIGSEAFTALVVPYAKHLPGELIRRLAALSEAGLPVIYADALPDGVEGNTVRTEKLADYFLENGWYDVQVTGEYPFLRIFHIRRGETDILMLFNESPDRIAETTLLTKASGDYTRLRLAEDIAVTANAADGEVQIRLAPGQSEILVFGKCDGLPAEILPDQELLIGPVYEIELADSDHLSDFRHYRTTDRLFSVTSPDGIPDFSGKIRYTFQQNIDFEYTDCLLDLGFAASTARLYVNGYDAGIRVATPYRFDIGKYLIPGENTFTVEVSNTLAFQMRDHLSQFLQLAPSGLLGPVRLLYR